MVPSELDGPSTESERILRYLSGRLSEAEAQTFEADCAARQDLRQSVELSLRLREGLARLRDTGELEVRTRFNAARWWGWAAAASVAATAVVLSIWLSFKTTSTPLLTAAPPRILSPSELTTYRFVSMRGGDDTAVAITPAGDFVLLKIRPNDLGLSSASETSGSYRVSLARRSTQAGVSIVAGIDDVTVGDDGFVNVYARPAGLSAGPYVLSIAPLRHAADSTRFDLEIRRGPREPQSPNAAPSP